MVSGDGLDQCRAGATLHRELAAQQVDGLHTVRALVNQVEPVVAVALLDVELFGTRSRRAPGSP